MPSEGPGSLCPWSAGGELLSLEPTAFSFSMVCGDSETFSDGLLFDRHDLLFFRSRAREDRRMPILGGGTRLRGCWWAGNVESK